MLILLFSWHLIHLSETSWFCVFPSLDLLHLSLPSPGPWLLAHGLLTSKAVPQPPSYLQAPAQRLVHGAWCLVHGSAGPMLFELEGTDSVSLSPILIIPWFVPLITTSPNIAPLFFPNLCWSWLETWFWFLLNPDCYCLNLELDPEFPKLVLGQVFILFYYAHYSPCKVQSASTELQSVKTPVNHTKL